MKNLTQGFWNQQIDAEPLFAPLQGLEIADIVIIGGGLSGMWLAHDLKELEPDLEVAILEKSYCGSGPSGMSGGIVYNYWYSLPLLIDQMGVKSARDLATFSEEMVSQIGTLPDIEWKEGGALHVATNSYQDAAADDKKKALSAAGRGDLYRSLSPKEVQEIARSPLFRSGTLYPGVRSVNPAKLSRALRSKVAGLGALIFEESEAIDINQKSGWHSVRTPLGEVRARYLVFASGATGRFSNRDVVASSSYMVVTEPLADIDRFWPGDEAITDERASVRYMRKTEDGRVAFGWGFGRAGGKLDKYAGEEVSRVFKEFFPQWKNAKIEYSWGGAIDISPTHLPLIKEVSLGIWSVGGYTGNGVGGTRVAARMLASRVLSDAPAKLSFPSPALPPPKGKLGEALANLIRLALLRREAAEQREEKPALFARVISRLPEKLGVRLAR